MFSSEEYPKDTTEFLINEKLGALIKECKEQIYTKEFKDSPEFNTQETELATLGMILSKYCEWDGEYIKTVALGAFDDANFRNIEINL